MTVEEEVEDFDLQKPQARAFTRVLVGRLDSELQCCGFTDGFLGMAPLRQVISQDLVEAEHVVFIYIEFALHAEVLVGFENLEVHRTSGFASLGLWLRDVFSEEFFELAVVVDAFWSVVQVLLRTDENLVG